MEVCRNQEIDLILPAYINENELFKYNSSSDYYNDICYLYRTPKNTDITLNDRKLEFNNNNYSLCEVNCEYEGYIPETKKSKCKCKIKIKIPMITEIDINTNILLYKFKNLKNGTNIGVIKCYYMLFKKNGLKKNIGSYILLSLILVCLLFTFIFKFKDYKLLIYIIDKIIYMKNQKKIKQGKNNENKKLKINGKNINKRKKIKNKKTKINKLKADSGFSIKNTSIRKIINNNINVINNNDNNFNILLTDKLKKNNFINNYNDNELNSLSYVEAKKNDKRSYIEYYLSLLRTNQILIFTFYTSNDYNMKSIKICIFLFSFSLFYTINALFFNDKTMHKIYLDEGEFNFIYQIPQLLYSTIISSVIINIIKYLSLSEKNVIKLKNCPENNHLKIKNILIIKFYIFFILFFLFLIGFWFYISCFCFVYKNTQIYLIKDTLISFSLSFLYPLVLCLLPGCFRIPSLRSKEKDKEFMFIFSNLLQSIL